MIRNLLLTIGLILFTGVILHAQQAALQGKVLDKDTKEPIPFANIIVEKIIPDALCLAANNKQWVCLNYLDNSYLQTDTLNGMIFSHDILPYVVTNMLQDEKQVIPEKILFFNESFEKRTICNTLAL